MFSKSFALLAASAALLALATPSSALSWELCDSYASEWVTDSPHLEGKFPFYSLIFSCNGKPICMQPVPGASKPVCNTVGVQLEFLIHRNVSYSSFEVQWGSFHYSGDENAMRILLAPSAGGLNIEGKQVDACVNNGTACGQPAADAFCKYIGFDGANPDMEQTAPADEPVRAVTGETLGYSRLAVSLQAKCCLVTVLHPVPP